MTDHHINVWHSAEDGGYIAEIPDLPGCSAFGATPEEAAAEVSSPSKHGSKPPGRAACPCRLLDIRPHGRGTQPPAQLDEHRALRPTQPSLLATR
jgi:hypothetical protein